ncbi:hypothetical protein MMC34_007036 [Xylographa carneopallida]|nr:hypothetical protein [Xylographa carneopallida]
MPTKWNSDSELKLAMAVIKLNNVKPKSWDTVAAMMGENYNGNSVRQHYQKILKSVAFATDAASTSTAASALTAITNTSIPALVKTLKLPLPPGRGKSNKSLKKHKKSEEDEEETEEEGSKGAGVSAQRVDKEGDESEDEYIEE